MVVIRPVSPSDLDRLVELAHEASFGLTTLPRDKELLRERILESCHSFETRLKRRGETYLFVLEDIEAGGVAGTCGVTSKVGGFEPFYAYRLETVVRHSRVLNVRREVRMLHLERRHSGPSEIGSLFILPSSRRRGVGRLLSLSRFMFMAEFPDRFEPLVIAEMRGVVDESGHSPFWEVLGKRFFDLDFPSADLLSMKDKRFIDELMPIHPIYVVLLPREAQEVIGQVHPETRPALRMLEEEGFRFDGRVDIFEGGPIVSCPLEEIRTVRDSARAMVAEVSGDDDPSGAFLLANARIDFRACLGAVSAVEGGGVRIAKRAAEALNVGPGDTIRYAPLRPAGRGRP